MEFLTTLKILTSIANKDSKITWISSNVIPFDNVDEEKIVQTIGNEKICKHIELETISIQQVCMGKNVGWLGALINRETYLNIGGMPGVNTGIGDTLMQYVYADRYMMNKCNCEYPMYNYRIWGEQTSAKDSWTNNYLALCIFYFKCCEKYHRKMYYIWKYIYWRRILEGVAYIQETKWNPVVSVQYIQEVMNVPDWWNKKGLVYYIVTIYRIIYEKWICRKNATDLII